MKNKAAGLFSVRTSNQKMFYRDVLETLNAAKIRFLVGGGHAFTMYSGTSRKTKDMDLFVRPADVEITLRTLADKRYETELCYPHWLGKIYCQRDFIDLIFSSGNGVCTVDDGWFEYAVAGQVFDVPVNFCPPEEMIWAKAFVMDVGRFHLGRLRKSKKATASDEESIQHDIMVRCRMVVPKYQPVWEE